EIETRLRNGRMVLTRDNVELRQLYEHVEQQRLPVQKNAYLGELVMDELQNLLDTTDDPQKANRSRLALQDVADRVQNLRILDEVFAQFFVGIEMTRRNNAQLGRAVERTLSVATNVVTVGLAIQTALSRQREIMEANTRTREFIGDLIVSNASAINRHTQEIGEVFKNPVIAMDKLTQAHNELVEAMETANRLRDEGFQIARENITNLRELTEDFQQRIGSVQEADSIESIEA
ncbi:MAG: toxic anion resistance protein, partial [SAR202 cluster bacterium]|nr:toxic anion resistance protein [SAR202 cluster bacterium]